MRGRGKVEAGVSAVGGGEKLGAFYRFGWFGEAVRERWRSLASGCHSWLRFPEWEAMG
jgi:hypothetical protein